MKPQEKDYVSHVSYTRALEAYCENIENEQIDLADKTREECAKLCEFVKSNWNYCAAAIRDTKERS